MFSVLFYSQIPSLTCSSQHYLLFSCPSQPDLVYTPCLHFRLCPSFLNPLQFEARVDMTRQLLEYREMDHRWLWTTEPRCPGDRDAHRRVWCSWGRMRGKPIWFYPWLLFRLKLLLSPKEEAEVRVGDKYLGTGAQKWWINWEHEHQREEWGMSLLGRAGESHV